MSDYNNLLIQISQVEAIPGPPASQLRTLQHWLYDGRGGNSFLKGAETFTWDSNDASEYVSLKRTSSENDVFTRFIKRVMSLFFFHRIIGGKLRKKYVIDEEAGIVSYDDEKLDSASNFIAVVVSSTLLVLTIFVLNALETTSARVTVAFTAAFAGLLAVFSEAKRVEIFAATATFAAIEVVFIGTSLSSSSNGAS